MLTSKVRLTFTLLVSILLICCFAGCGGKSKNDTWPDGGLGSMLPKPESKKIHIGNNLDDTFSADIKNAKAEDFTAYVAKCKEIGFTVDADSDSDDYTSYNTDGYKLSISFYDSLQSVSIMLSTPKVNGTFSWPTIGLATLLPTPDTNVGTITINSSIQFNAYIGETTFDDYKVYVNQCIENGFNVGYNNGEKVFSDKNNEGDSVSLEYQGFDTMYISMYAHDNGTDKTENKTENSETTKADNDTQSKENANLIDGMRPEFKEAMDSYEDFMNDYCDFMKKYNQAPTDLSLLADYTSYMSKYAETMKKIEAIDESELSDAELNYYLEVTGRVTEKLVEVAK